VFWDRRAVRAGSDIPDAVRYALHHVDLAVVCWSDAARYAGWVKAEIGEAERLLKRLVLIDQATPMDEVRSRVDEPNEVFDAYGRFVGEIWLPTYSINEWLLRTGWAIPAFYSSMTAGEIERFTALANQGYGAGAWPWYRDRVTGSQVFDWSCRMRPKGSTPNPAADRGPFLMPKLFRRVSTWAVNRRAKMVTSSFLTYLRTKIADTLHLTDEFVAQGSTAAPTYHLADLFTDGSLGYWPEEIVFREKPSTLLGPNGKIPRW
jgi:hypothetical protein